MVDKDRIKKLLDKVYRLNYWFCNEMLIDEQHAAEFEEACKKANESGEPVIMVSTAEGNAKCILGTLSGVANYDDLTVNGGTTDITIEPYEIPTVKKVNLT